MESPFQLLQVNELIQLENIGKYEIIIRLNDLTRNNQQMNCICNIFELNNVRRIKCNPKTACLLLPAYLVFKSLFAKMVYIGDESSRVFQVLKKMISVKKVVLLDDGVATINREAKHDNYNRFSFFAKGSNVLNNEFEYLSDHLKKSVTGEKVNLIIGAKLVEEGICTQSNYIYSLEVIMKEIDLDVPTIYIPHRGEVEANLGVLKKRLNLQIIHTELPIELVGVELQVKPINIYTFFSTALFSMNLIYKETNIVVFRMNYDHLLERKEAIIKLYDYIEEWGVVPVYNLEDL